MAESPTLAQLISTYVERARILNLSAANLLNAGDAADAAGLQGGADTYELVGRELTEVVFPAPDVQTELASLREENARLRRQRDKVAGWHGIDLSELEEQVP